MIPLLGLTGIPALLEFLEVRLNDQKEDISILQLLDGSLLRSPGLFYAPWPRGGWHSKNLGVGR